MDSRAVLARVGLEDGLQFASEDHGLDATRIRVVRGAGVGAYDRHKFSVLCRGARSDLSGANGAEWPRTALAGPHCRRAKLAGFFRDPKGVLAPEENSR